MKRLKRSPLVGRAADAIRGAIVQEVGKLGEDHIYVVTDRGSFIFDTATLRASRMTAL